MENLVRARIVAERLSVSEPTLYRMARKGLIPHVRFGDRIAFDPVKLEAWIEKHSVGVAD